MIWFSYLVTPLGSNLRIKGHAIIDLGQDGDVLKKLDFKISLKLKPIECSNIDELVELISIDPDVADLIKLGIKKYITGYME